MSVCLSVPKEIKISRLVPHVLVLSMILYLCLCISVPLSVSVSLSLSLSISLSLSVYHCLCAHDALCTHLQCVLSGHGGAFSVRFAAPVYTIQGKQPGDSTLLSCDSKPEIAWLRTTRLTRSLALLMGAMCSSEQVAPTHALLAQR